jgi:hypothetical protein
MEAVTNAEQTPRAWRCKAFPQRASGITTPHSKGIKKQQELSQLDCQLLRVCLIGGQRGLCCDKACFSVQDYERVMTRNELEPKADREAS